MDLGSEISKSFKDSIKQKLKECGTYIDDELPEYIMVMIANKRQEEQMKEDLSLFLGDETNNFVEWLFQKLTNLQNVAQDKLLQPGNSNLQSKEAKKDEKIENGDEEANKESTKEVPMKTLILTEGESNVIDEKLEIKDGSGEVDILDENDIEIGNKARRKRKSSDENKRRKIEDKSLLIKGVSESKDDLLQKYSPKRRKSSTSKKDEDATIDMEKETKPQTHIASTSSVQKIRPSLPRSRQPPGSLVMKAIKEANQSVAMKPRRGHGQIEIERADDFVERKVELKRGGIKLNEKTTLIVQENEADNKVDNEIEASEVENSAKRKDHGEEEKPQEDGIELEVPENEFLDEDDESRSKSNKRIVISHGDADDDVIRKEESQRTRDGEKGNSERGRKRDNDKREGSYDDNDEDKERSNRKRRRHKRERSSHREKRKSSPKFIVTLHGALSERTKDEKRNRRDKDPLFIDLNPKGPMAIFESAQNEIEKMARQLDLLQNSVSSSEIVTPFLSSQATAVLPPNSGMISSITRPVFQETLPIMSANNGLARTNLIGPQNRITLPGPSPVIAMQLGSENNERARQRIPDREIVVPLESEVGVQNDDDEDMENGIQNENHSDTVLERCKFWPNCKNPTCVYIHPSKPCRMFPNCNFKDKCLYIHPMCKFDRRCNNADCTFTHTTSFRNTSNFNSNVSSAAAVRNNLITPLCKFIPNCTKTNCPFRHPIGKPCRFGSGCKKPNCQFHHETKPATGDALKWSNTSSSAHQHISERRYAAPDKDIIEVPVEIKTKLK